MSLRKQGFSLKDVARDNAGDCRAASLRNATLAFMGLQKHQTREFLSACNLQTKADITAVFQFARHHQRYGAAISTLTGFRPEELWPSCHSTAPSSAVAAIDAARSSKLEQAIGELEAFEHTIVALPVSKDVRYRLRRKLRKTLSILREAIV